MSRSFCSPALRTKLRPGREQQRGRSSAECSLQVSREMLQRTCAGSFSACSYQIPAMSCGSNWLCTNADRRLRISFGHAAAADVTSAESRTVNILSGWPGVVGGSSFKRSDTKLSGSPERTHKFRTLPMRSRWKVKIRSPERTHKFVPSRCVPGGRSPGERERAQWHRPTPGNSAGDCESVCSHTAWAPMKLLAADLALVTGTSKLNGLMRLCPRCGIQVAQ